MEKQYTNAAQLRACKTIKALFGHEVSGIECAELAKRLDNSKAQVYKDLCVLEQAGFAEQMPDSKRWRIAPTLGREAVKIMNALGTARRKMNELAGRYDLPQDY